MAYRTSVDQSRGNHRIRRRFTRHGCISILVAVQVANKSLSLEKRTLPITPFTGAHKAGSQSITMQAQLPTNEAITSIGSRGPQPMIARNPGEFTRVTSTGAGLSQLVSNGGIKSVRPAGRFNGPKTHLNHGETRCGGRDRRI